MKNNYFYYVLFDEYRKEYVKDFNLFGLVFTDIFLYAFEFLDFDCAVACLNEYKKDYSHLRLRKIALREYDMICQK